MRLVLCVLCVLPCCVFGSNAQLDAWAKDTAKRLDRHLPDVEREAFVKDILLNNEPSMIYPAPPEDDDHDRGNKFFARLKNEETENSDKLFNLRAKARCLVPTFKRFADTPRQDLTLACETVPCETLSKLCYAPEVCNHYREKCHNDLTLPCIATVPKALQCPYLCRNSTDHLVTCDNRPLDPLILSHVREDHPRPPKDPEGQVTKLEEGHVTKGDLLALMVKEDTAASLDKSSGDQIDFSVQNGSLSSLHPAALELGEMVGVTDKPSEKPEQNDHVAGLAIAGAAVGGVGLIGGIAFYVMQRKGRRNGNLMTNACDDYDGLTEEGYGSRGSSQPGRIPSPLGSPTIESACQTELENLFEKVADILSDDDYDGLQ